jgi:hypothetical protein
MNTFDELMCQITRLIQLFINDKKNDHGSDTDDIIEVSDPNNDEYDTIPQSNILNTLDMLRKMEKKTLD